MNLLLAALIFSFVFMFHGAPAGLSNEVASIVPGSEAEKIGLQIGDKVTAINGKKIEAMDKAIKLIHSSGNKALRLTLERNNKSLVLNAVPQYDEKLKVGLIGFSPKIIYERYNPLRALWAGIVQTFLMGTMILYFFGQLIAGKLAPSGIAGPLGIAQISGQYASRGFLAFVQFLAFFNINVAILNLLPIPALDGGRLVFVILEAIRRKPIKIETENKVHYAGIIVLLALVALFTINDLIRIFTAN